ncbi:hypothetical protein LCGC14_2369680, partial [marine sediment metagenome]
MTYTTSAKVQARSGVTTSEVSATHMTAILAWTDQEIDTIVENAYYYSEYFENQKDERVIIMNDVSTVSINNTYERLPKRNIMTDIITIAKKEAYLDADNVLIWFD